MYTCIAELPFFQQFNEDKKLIIAELEKNNRFGNDESKVSNNDDNNKKNNIINNNNNNNNDLGNNIMKNYNNKFQIDTENNSYKGNKKNCVCK